MFEREKLIIGDKINNINGKTVLIVGVGGVGGYALESIVRAGIGKVIIVDNDIVDITNLNRQIITLHENVGEKKILVAKKRALSINPNINIETYDMFLTENNIEELFNNKIDYVIDACDTISTKKAIIRICIKKKIKFISSMGTGNKLDPTKLEIIDVRKTSYDPIAKIIRKMVKDERIKAKIPVICSKELPIKTKDKVGSISYVPAVAGLYMTSYIINDILRSDDNV